MSKEPKEHDKQAAYEWGLSVGRVHRANSLSICTPYVTGLKGILRASFALGLVAGYDVRKDMTK